MSFVHVLDDNTINKIAAGEVVERPASVVKELVENSIDARADRIEVEILAGGTSYMRITDNGIGMSKEDAGMAILRHATSKILKVDDLQSIDTLGFRGEALPSIAAVSRFSLTTRQAGAELGTAISITGGRDVEIEDTGCSLGTTIKVEDLFFNTPARKKFLKTTNTEGSKINEFIIKLAISNPQIAFKLISNNKTVVSTPGNGSLFDTIKALYGTTVGESLLEIDFADSEAEVELKGYVSKPSTIRSSRSWQTLLVNGRIISNRAISKAIDNAYHALIPRSGYPLVALNITVPQNTIDVNVHPQKSELKFEDESRIFKAVYKAVLEAVHAEGSELSDRAAQVEMGAVQRHITNSMGNLAEIARPMTGADRSNGFSGGHGFGSFSGGAAAGSHSFGNGGSMAGSDRPAGFSGIAEGHGQWQMNSLPNLDASDGSGINRNGINGNGIGINGISTSGSDYSESQQGGLGIPSPAYEMRQQEQGGVRNMGMRQVVDKETGEIHLVNSSEPGLDKSLADAETLASLSAEPAVQSRQNNGKMVPIGQVDNTYIIAQDRDGLYIVDQHAAHERILYDRFASQADRIPAQQLLVHLLLDFSTGEAQLIEKNQQLFLSLGFGLEPSGDNQFRLTEVPADIPVGEAEEIIREILTDLNDMHQPTAAELRHACLATTACKAAIKAGFPLSFHQMEIILEELNASDMPYTCPHGRPTILKFSSDELAKMFKRTGF
ncbi:MAG: DNA mismatch repair endonuclease MutL [Anaerovibrio sp.]|nr:DNA mismatch repair endonuclease MutL [Selenomonadaceae bacterium]MDY6053634.1 DNA mismatch repair endonuclease MutL [Anaerovibrio sp.]